MKQIHKILCLLLCVAVSLSAAAREARTVSGVILDENNEPAIGAVVRIKGETLGALTGTDGRFTLHNVDLTQKALEVSSLGYATQTVDISAQGEVTVTLVPAANDLDEVVIVGYGVQKKAHMTGAIATIAPSEISDLSSANLSNMLQGQVTGVSVNSTSNRPGEAARIIIRPDGIAASSDESTSPLFVIDDFISTQAAFNNLDPTMIESMTILKDAAAAVYGARSAQGVVIVRTKSGQAGKPKISYSGQYGYADEFYRSKVMNAYDHGVAWNAYRAADPRQTGFDSRQHLFQHDELEAMKSLNYDLLEQYWRGALTQKHGVTVSGGSENATYFGGVSFQTQDGNLGKISYERWNVNAGMNTKVNRWTTAAVRVSGDWGETRRAHNQVGGQSAERDYDVLLKHARYIPEFITTPDGRELPVVPMGIRSVSSNHFQMYHFNTLMNLGDYTHDMPQNMVVNGSLDFDLGFIELLKGLKVKGTYSKSINTEKQNRLQSSYELWQLQEGTIGRGGSGNHLYVDTDENPMNFDNMSTVKIINGSASQLRREMKRSDSYQLNFTASYARDFGKHSVSGLFTAEKSESEYENVFGSVTQPYSFTNLQSNGADGERTTEFTRSEAGTLSYVGRFNYAYDDKYLLEFLMRSDASTKFAPENYWGTFPSLSLGWIMSKEAWFHDNVQFVDFFKVRGSFGRLGRDNVPAWAWLPTYRPTQMEGAIFGEGLSTIPNATIDTRNTIPNRNSKWDKVYKTNLGFDMNFLKSRMSVALEGYYDMARETFMTLDNAPEFPATVGGAASPSNYGENDMYGVEISLGWKDKVGDVKYNVKLSTGYSDNKRLKFPGQDNVLRKDYYKETRTGERNDRGVWGMECIGMFRTYQEIAEYFEENHIYSYFGNTIDGVHPGMLIYRDIRGSQAADGSYYPLWDGTYVEEVDKDGKTIMVPNSADPTVRRLGGNVIDGLDEIRIASRKENIYGFTLNGGVEWKGIAVSAQLGASWGSYNMMPGIKVDDNTAPMDYVSPPAFYAGNYFVYEDVFDAQGRVVAAQNRDAKYPSLRFSDNFKESTFWRVNAANVLLRNLTVSYTIPKSLVNKLGVESCRLNLTGQNLLEFYNPYPDKYTSVNGKYGEYPYLRKWTLGLNVTF